MDLHYISATEAIDKFKNKSLSPVELIKAIIKRAEEINPKINAHNFTFYEEAIEKAVIAEKKYFSNSDILPLEGIPVAIKDEEDIKGQPNTNGSLVIHRVKFNFGANGMYTTILDRVGKPQYTETWEPPLADVYSANKVGINDQITQTVPTYEKNKNLTLTLKSSHPAPATLYSMTWEGDFTNAYYRSV